MKLIIAFALVLGLSYHVGALPRGGRGGRGGGGRSSSSSGSSRSSSSSGSSRGWSIFSRRSSSSSSSSSRSSRSSLRRSSRGGGTISSSRRRWGLLSSSGGARWVAPSSARSASFSSLKPILQRVKSNKRTTWSGTKFKQASDLDTSLQKGYSRKQLGIGASAGFIGGASYGYGSGMASYSVYHRYQRYRWYRRHRFYHADDDWDDDYYSTYYQRNDCEHGCPENTHCEWGLCECNEGYTKSWGVCRAGTNTDLRNEEQGSREEGGTCSSSTDCTSTDINMVCIPNLDGDLSCRCRRDMRWNRRALECQLHLDVDCSNLTYTSTVSPEVLSAAEKVEHRRRGWTTEEDKKMKIFNLPKVNKAFWNSSSFFESSWGMDFSMCHVISGCDLFEDRSCTGCRMDELAAQLAPGANTSIPTDRTETPEESLEESILSILTSSNSTNLTRNTLDEAFCRDIEAFSEAFQVDDLFHRPDNCQPIASDHCAVLYDSSTCATDSWQLLVKSGEQRQLEYWSSDWKYRNDADVVGVRNGCSFTGWTGSSFDEDSFTLNAGVTDRWVLFAESQLYRNFDESILSFQCNCRG